MITIDDLFYNNYEEVELNHSLSLLYPYVDRMFQKRVKDSKGTKYFIDVYCYDTDQNTTMEFEIHSYINQVAIKTLFYGTGVKTLPEMEALIDEYFVNAKLTYYETEYTLNEEEKE